MLDIKKISQITEQGKLNSTLQFEEEHEDLVKVIEEKILDAAKNGISFIEIEINLIFFRVLSWETLISYLTNKGFKVYQKSITDDGQLVKYESPCKIIYIRWH